MVTASPTSLAPATVSRASLPEAYQTARRALAVCSGVDECKDWNDKHVALASYARQSKDESLLKYALRIQARAVRRAGEILDALPAVRNQHDRRKGAQGKREAGAAAGLSADQTRTAMRVARVPEEEFERLVDSELLRRSRSIATHGKRNQPTVVDAATLDRARTLVRLKELLRNLEDLAVQIDTIEDAADYFARRRDPALREQCRSARLFFAKLEGWLQMTVRRQHGMTVDIFLCDSDHKSLTKDCPWCKLGELEKLRGTMQDKIRSENERANRAEYQREQDILMLKSFMRPVDLSAAEHHMAQVVETPASVWISRSIIDGVELPADKHVSMRWCRDCQKCIIGPNACIHGISGAV